MKHTMAIIPGSLPVVVEGGLLRFSRTLFNGLMGEYLD